MTEHDNHRHWVPDAEGVYEVWYTTWNHPGTDQGFWLRFITEAPRPGSGGSPPYGEAPRAELWFARFDPKRPERTFGIHKRFRSDLFTSAVDPFAIRISGCELGHDHSFGELSGDGHDVRWDLRWEPAAETLHQLPGAMYARGGLGETTVLSPNPRVPLSGTLLVDGEELAFDRAIAGQTHLWGKKHAYSWTWGRCAELSGCSDGLLELLGVKLQRGGVTTPTMTLISLDLDGEQHRFNQFRHLAGNRSSWATPRVTFSAWSASAKIEGELSCEPKDMVNAPYLDPDGTEVFCVNTEIGDARITIWKRSGLRWREHKTLEGKRRAHFEIGGRTRDEQVRCPHVLVS
jgi:hypothetical protein